MGHRLFSYGTLRDPHVQRAVFGRELAETPDAVTGFRLGEVVIDDPAVVGASGLEVHRILHPTGDPADVVEGAVLELAAADLVAADAYETSAYRRIGTTARSGASVFIYVAA